MRPNVSPTPFAPCLKCGGNIYFSKDLYGPYLSCRQCGNLTDLLLTDQQSIPAPAQTHVVLAGTQTSTGRR